MPAPLRLPFLLAADLTLLAACPRGGAGDDTAAACTVGVLQPFEVRLVVLTQREDAPSATSTHLDLETGETLTGAEVLDREVQILDQYFVAADRSAPCVDGSCVTFRAKDYAFYDDVKDTSCSLIQFGDQSAEQMYTDADQGYADKMAEAVWECDDQSLASEGTMGFYVVDAYNTSVGFPNVDHWGSSNVGRPGANRPFIALDIAQLLHARDAAEENAMGEVLLMGRTVCDPCVQSSTDDSNIMQGRLCCDLDDATCQIPDTGEECPPSDGGARNLGFDEDQVARIVEVATQIQETWCDL